MVASSVLRLLLALLSPADPLTACDGKGGHGGGTVKVLEFVKCQARH